MDKAMISLEKALQILHGVPVKSKEEEVPIGQTLNRVLAQDIVSMINMPPFHKSAMDGYAFNSNDTSAKFQVVETIPAGAVPAKEIKNGQCAKIMTGAMVPGGADRVIKRELTVEENGFMRITREENNRNICLKGEDVKVGDVVLNQGVRIRPSEVGVIASMGLSKIKVYRRPEVGIIATGSELVQPGRSVEKGKIYDSNSFSLAAQVEHMGVILARRGFVEDSRETIRSAVKELLETCDMVLVSGGVSAGEFDYVPGVLQELGVRLHFEKVAIKPGKPTVFGTRKEKIIFGVPGNPVSTFVIFEIFIKPLLFRMMGHKYHPDMFQGILKEDFRRRRVERTAFFPAHYQDGFVEVLQYHGSAHIHALSRANGLICIQKGSREIKAGSDVNVRSI